MEAEHAIHEAASDAKRKVEQWAGGPARFQVILVLACILALDTGDKATISAVAGSLEAVFHVGNTAIGLLISAVSFVGAVFTLPIGSLVDRIRRKTILLWAIVLWSAAMAVSGLATSFLFMLLTRLALGAVTAAASPSVASLTGDFFPARDRARVYGMILAGELVGTGIGFFIGGSCLRGSTGACRSSSWRRSASRWSGGSGASLQSRPVADRAGSWRDRRTSGRRRT